MLVCIDPGHGGHDPGAVGIHGTKESDITLKISLLLAKYLSELKINSILTRQEDIFIPLSSRAKIANQHNADLFVSIHCNAAFNRNALGAETYHFPASEEGKKLAVNVQNSLVQSTGLIDRGVKDMSFQVLRQTKMPAILVEVAFISNQYEEWMLGNETFQKMCAQAIAEGIEKYLAKED